MQNTHGIINRITSEKDNILRMISVFSLKVGSSVLALLVGITLSRILGVEEFGQYSLAIAWVTFLQIPALMGMRPFIVRESARARTDISSISEVYKTAAFVTIVTSSLLVVITLPVISVFSERLNINYSNTVAAIVALPILTLCQVRQGVLQGVKRISIGLIPESLLMPVFFLSLIIAAKYLWGGVEANTILILRSFCIIGVYLLGIILMIKTVSLKRTVFTLSRFDIVEVQNWLKKTPPFLLIAFSHMIYLRANLLIIGAYTDVESVGLYSVAQRGAEIAFFPQMAIDAVASSVIAGMASSARQEKLRVYAKYCVLCLTVTTLIALPLMFLGHYFLELFGSGFMAAEITLKILCLGQIFNSVSGPGVVYLCMLNQESLASRIILLIGFFNLLLNLFLIPRFGIEGAAWATCATSALQTIILIFLICRKSF
jgi:O-antigen/teichoic acid export membrane protein